MIAPAPKGSARARLLAVMIERGLTSAEVKSDKQLRARLTGWAGLDVRPRADVWRSALVDLQSASGTAARAHPGTGRCKKCGEPIWWVTTKATGKAMSLDPLPRPDGNVILVPASSRGTKVVASVVPPRALPVHGVKAYQSHFASCPFADQMRRRRESRRAQDRSGLCPGVRPDTGAVCDEPMAPWLLENGYKIHPTCEEST